MKLVYTLLDSSLVSLRVSLQKVDCDLRITLVSFHLFSLFSFALCRRVESFLKPCKHQKRLFESRPSALTLDFPSLSLSSQPVCSLESPTSSPATTREKKESGESPCSSVQRQRQCVRLSRLVERMRSHDHRDAELKPSLLLFLDSVSLPFSFSGCFRRSFSIRTWSYERYRR